jgi:hypothetical protein
MMFKYIFWMTPRTRTGDKAPWLEYYSLAVKGNRTVRREDGGLGVARFQPRRDGAAISLMALQSWS